MTADLTPLIERQKALRRQFFWTNMTVVIGATAWVAIHGFTWWHVLLALGVGAAMLGAHMGKKHWLARLELDQTTASLETQRILLRRSGDRRDAAEGLSLSNDAAGGELSVGQDGELSKDR